MNRAFVQAASAVSVGLNLDTNHCFLVKRAYRDTAITHVGSSLLPGVNEERAGTKLNTLLRKVQSRNSVM